MIGKTILHYRILEKLGEGGMGVVYKAEDFKLQRLVALKFLPKEWTPNETAKRRLIAEARAASRLNHPNIATVYALEESEQQAFLTMEFVDGVSIAELVHDHGISSANIVRIAIQAADALSAAHAEGIVHGDIKPDNLMQSRTGILKVMDFGIAGSTVTDIQQNPAETAGTIAYMSPEQAQHQILNNQSDIFSLGSVLYELATGSRPFDGKFEAEILYAIVNEQPRQIRHLRNDLPDALESIIFKCLSKSVQTRYQNARTLISDLAAIGEAAVQPENAKKRFLSLPLREHRNWHLAGLAIAAATLFISIRLFLASGLEHEPVPVFRNSTTFELDLHPAFSPDSSQLAYSSYQHCNSDIWVKNLRTGERLNLTSAYVGDDDAPAWSPDGKWIAFRSDRDGGGIFLMPATGGVVRKLAIHAGMPRWSPDGSSLLYSANSKIYLFDFGASAESMLQLPHPGKDPDWHPDGERIVYVHQSGSKSALWLTYHHNSEFQLVYQGTSPSRFLTPRISQDGERILFKHVEDRKSYVKAVKLKDRVQNPETPATLDFVSDALGLRANQSVLSKIVVQGANTGTYAAYIPFLPESTFTLKKSNSTFAMHTIGHSTKIPIHTAHSTDTTATLMHSNLSGNYDIWLKNSAEKKTELKTVNFASDIYPGWLPGADRFVFQSNRSGNFDIYLKSIDASTLERLTSHQADDIHPAISPDGQLLAFTSSRAGNEEIWLLGMSSKRLERLTNNLSYDAFPAWSPTGKTLSFYSRRSGNGELYIYDFSTRSVRQLTHLGSHAKFGWQADFYDARHSWVEDGSSVIFAAEIDEVDQGGDIWSVSVPTGKLHRLLSFNFKDVRRNPYKAEAEAIFAHLQAALGISQGNLHFTYEIHKHDPQINFLATE